MRERKGYLSFPPTGLPYRGSNTTQVAVSLANTSWVSTASEAKKGVAA